MTEKPTPVLDVLDRWLMRDQLRVFAEFALFGLAIFLVADYLQVMWVIAGSLVFTLMTGTVAILGYTWRRFKQWRYPAYYNEEVQ